MRLTASGICKKFNRLVSADAAGAQVHGRSPAAASVQEEFYAVDHVDLMTAPGEILGILGPNGAGKTTLLRILGMLMRADEGVVRLTEDDGTELTDSVECKRRIGYLSENTKLYQRLSARELLHTIAGIYGLSPEEERQRIGEICEVLQMSSFIDNRIERLSTGQTQRANIARCLIHSPGVYIFDEPTLGLDILSSESIVEFMKSERDKGHTVIYSTHYMEEAQYLCDRIHMMYRGRIIADGTPQELMRRTGTQNLRDSFRILIGRVSVSAEPGAAPQTGESVPVQTDGMAAEEMPILSGMPSDGSTERKYGA